MSCQVGESCGCNFKNTGMKYGEVWDHMHGLIDKEVGCEECNVHGHQGIDGLRDHIAAGIGKKVHDRAKYNRFVNEVLCVRDRCRAEGRC